MDSPANNLSDELSRSYEALPYESGPHYPTHPDCLATVATLMGLRPADVGRARVLELGCGNGGNLIPMAAALPDARFFGVDLAPRQIDQGHELIEAAGLENIELHAADLLELGPELGPFDYVICHGVYSWVPEPVRDKILSICRDNLAPNGVAYVSYNTYPGWHFRGVARDMLDFHTRHLEQPEDRLAEARGFLNFLVQSIPDNETPYARVLRSEAEGFQREPDYYLVHEFLDEVNQPCYFYQFVEAAAAKGLRYLAEAWYHTRLDDLPAQVQQTIRDISPDLVHVEQYLDFLRKRSFRRTLLCHDSVQLSRAPALEQILGLSASAMAWPLEATDADSDPQVMRFRTAMNQVITTNHPAVKAVFCRLWDRYPQSIEVAELIADVRGEIGRQAGTAPLQDADLAALLAQCFLSNSLMFHVHPPRFAAAVSEWPEASALARVQAARGQAVANRRHRQFQLNEVDRQVLLQLDGRHDRGQLVAGLERLLAEGGLDEQQLRQAVPEMPSGPDRLESVVDASLQRLRSHAFLVA